MKLTPQQLFDRACDILRQNGNPYGSHTKRGWGWVNPYNTSERCTLAQLVDGESTNQIRVNLQKLFGQTPVNAITVDEVSFSFALNNEYAICNRLINLFDHQIMECNDKNLLEGVLKSIADVYGLVYHNENIKKEVHYSKGNQAVIDYCELVE